MLPILVKFLLAMKFAAIIENKAKQKEPSKHDKEKEEFLKEGLQSVLGAMSPPLLPMDTVEEPQIDQLGLKFGEPV